MMTELEQDTLDTITVVMADDNPVIRMGLAGLLELAPGIELVDEAESGPDALHIVQQRAESGEPVDVLLLDVRMPRGGGLSVLAEAASLTKVLMMTYTDEPEIVAQALSMGATGYLVHGTFDSHELGQAIRDTAGGDTRLSPAAAAVLMQRARRGDGDAPTAQVLEEPVTEHAPPADDSPPSAGIAPGIAARYALSEREEELCQLLVRGMRNAEIAKELYIEPKTVKNHLNRIFAKLAVASRGEATAVLLGIRDVGENAS